MLQFMRKHAKFFYIFFFLIIISFIFFYVGPVDKSTTVPVAEIGKEKITIEEYWKTYDRMRDYYRSNSKEKFDEETEKKLRFREMVLEAMINEKVLLIAAKDLGLGVKDEELEEAITNDPMFVRNGAFNYDVYQGWLRINRIPQEFFENIKKLELTLVKVKRLIGESIDLTDVDIKQIKGGGQAEKTFKQLILLDQREKAVRSYVEGLKKQMKIKINTQLISS